jgi:hypothetical protein
MKVKQVTLAIHGRKVNPKILDPKGKNLSTNMKPINLINVINASEHLIIVTH